MSETEEVLERIVSTLGRFVVLPEYGALTVALYVLSTYLVDVARFAALLVARSPEMRCGKTTLMDIVGEMVRDPIAASNVSPAVLYRVMEAKKPTLLLDEVDAFLAQKSESSEAVRGILNAGHRRGRYSTIWRSNERGEILSFDVFGHKVLAGIGKVHATLRDRSITLTLRRKLPHERVERLRIADDDMVILFEEIREQCAAAAEEIRDEVRVARPEIPGSLSDRAADNWEALLAIADAAGGNWPQAAREAAKALSDTEGEDSHRVLLLADIRDYFEETGNTIAPSSDLLMHLNDLETRPWSTWHRDNPMTPRDLAKQLAPFGIEPKQRKLGGMKVRGYDLDDMRDTFSRYLQPSETAGTPVPEEDNSLQDRDLGGYRHEKGYRYNPVPDSDGTTQYRYHENTRYRDNSIQHNELDPDGTGVPDKSGLSVAERLASKGWARPTEPKEVHRN
jgi:putative DNA primase/helicase